jgi:hypothetical protein
MQTFRYAQPINVAAFRPALETAIPALAAADAYTLYTDDNATPTAGITLVVPSAIVKASVDAVVAAHNPATQTAAQQAATADATALADLTAQATAFLGRLDTIQTQMDTISNTAGTGTLASLTTAAKSEAAAIHDMAVGLARLVKALAAIVRRASA